MSQVKSMNYRENISLMFSNVIQIGISLEIKYLKTPHRVPAPNSTSFLKNLTLERVVSAWSGLWRKKIKVLFQNFSTGINLGKVTFSLYFSSLLHFPHVNTGTKGLKKAFYILSQMPPHAEKTRSKVKFFKNKMHSRARTLFGGFMYRLRFL